MIQVISLLIIARFALPVSALANNFLQEKFFTDKINKAENGIALGSKDVEKLKDFSLPQIDGVKETIKNSASFIQQKTIDFQNAVISTVNNAGSIIENLLALAWLYIGVFIIQVIALPLSIFWFFIKITNKMFDTNLQIIIDHSKLSGRNKVIDKDIIQSE